MQSFAAILSTVALALSISSVSSSPIKRSDDVTCKFQTEGFLTVLNYIPDGPSDPSHMNGNDTLVYLTKDNKLTIKPKEDEKLSQFDFYSCQSKFEKYQTQEKPLKDGDFNPDTTYFGHFAKMSDQYPQKYDATDCLTFNPETKEISDDACSFKDDDSQNFSFFSYESFGDTHGTTEVKFLGGPNGTSTEYHLTLGQDGRLNFLEGPTEDGLRLAFPGFID